MRPLIAASAGATHDLDDGANAAAPPPPPAAASAASAGAATAGLLSVSDAVLNLTLGYLDSDCLAVCQSCCRVLGSAAQSGEWVMRKTAVGSGVMHAATAMLRVRQGVCKEEA